MKFNLPLEDFLNLEEKKSSIIKKKKKINKKELIQFNKMTKGFENSKKRIQKATLAGGCFWCIEAELEKLEGVYKVVSGYTGGDKVNPSYQEVAKGQTGHLEAIQVFFDSDKISFSEILNFFWRQINPLDKEGQFVDRGKQYSTAIFYHNEEQKQIAQESKKNLEQHGPFKGKKIVTPIFAFKKFYKAESYHQDYYKKNPIKYKYYRYRSGRDQFLKKTWSLFKEQSLDFLNKDIEKKILKKNQEKIPFLTGKWSDLKKSRIGLKPPKEVLRRKLSKIQYQVTQEARTETPFKNLYWNYKEEGIYVDLISGEPLFSSIDKYQSETGWPSFKKPLSLENIVKREDRSLWSPRLEIRSKYADSHLGHVFQDGPLPLGLRYCINSAALKFIPKNQLKKEGYEEFLFLFFNEEK